MEGQFTEKIILILLEKGVLVLLLLGVGFWIKSAIEKFKSSEALKNEVVKVRLERITKFYDMFSEYEHWVNRIIQHLYYQKEKGESYLTKDELKTAIEKSDEIAKKIGLELNSMRFWINDDIYVHTVTQLELFKEIQSEIIQNGDFRRRKEFKLKMDTLRMNIDKLLPYLTTKQELKLVRYDRSFMYKK